MTDDKKLTDKQQADKKAGKFHYNPVGMAGRKAGIVEEIVKEEAAENSDGVNEDGKDDIRGRHPTEEKRRADR